MLKNQKALYPYLVFLMISDMPVFFDIMRRKENLNI